MKSPFKKPKVEIASCTDTDVKVNKDTLIISVCLTPTNYIHDGFDYKQILDETIKCSITPKYTITTDTLKHVRRYILSNIKKNTIVILNTDCLTIHKNIVLWINKLHMECNAKIIISSKEVFSPSQLERVINKHLVTTLIPLECNESPSVLKDVFITAAKRVGFKIHSNAITSHHSDEQDVRVSEITYTNGKTEHRMLQLGEQLGMVCKPNHIIISYDGKVFNCLNHMIFRYNTSAYDLVTNKKFLDLSKVLMCEYDHCVCFIQHNLKSVSEYSKHGF